MTSTDAFLAPALRSLLAESESLSKTMTNPETLKVLATQVRTLRLVLTRASRLAAEAAEAKAAVVANGGIDPAEGEALSIF